WNDEHFNLTGAGEPERVEGASVTYDFLTVLGVAPAVGRNFTPEEDLPGAPLTVILTYELWQRHFHGDRNVVGRPVLLNDAPATVAGVLPAGFRFPADYRPDALIPFREARQPEWKARRMGILHVVGRLRPGVTPEAAARDLGAVSARYEGEMPAFMKADRGVIRSEPLQQRLAGGGRPILMVLLGAVGLLLLIACVNVANLQLARATVRIREIGLRAALGASRWRVVRLLATESLAVSTIAGAAGLLIAVWILSLAKLAPGLPWHGADFEPGWTLTAAAFVFSTAAGLLIGVAPARFAPQIELAEVLKSGSAAVLSGRGAHARSALVVAQVALALLLLLGSGLLLRSLAKTLSVDLGFRPEGVLTAEVRLPESRYATDAQRYAFDQALLERLRGLPGVTTAATANSIPLTGYSMGMRLIIEGQPDLPPEKRPGAPILIVTPEYFRAMGIPLLAGRGFNSGDTATAQKIIVVNSRFAQQFFHGDAIGRHVRTSDTSPWATIVGIAGAVHHGGPERETDAQVFWPEAQAPVNNVKLVVRTANDPRPLASAVRAAVWEVDKDLPVHDLMTMDDRLSRAGGTRRMQTLLLASFALLAVCLAAIGIYGTVAHSVNQRTREIGLRMALGAEARDVRRMVMRRSAVLGGIGVAIGSAAALYLAGFLKKLLFGVTPTDLATFAGAAVLLLGVALAAGYVPARRASKIDPAAALRAE
ncbi:MAG TPA: ABC transporter permease, partial [Bryobacteraceae bacterium]